MSNSKATTTTTAIATTATATPATPPVPKVYLGLVFELNGVEIPLEPTTSTDEIETKGIECGLKPGQRVALGSIGESVAEVFDALGAERPDFLNEDGTINQAELPNIDVLQKIVNVIARANLNIENFHIKLPGSASADKTKYYTVGLSAIWPGDAGTLSETLKLKIKGIFFKISNE